MKFLLNKFEVVGAPTKIYEVIAEVETWTNISFYVMVETRIEDCPYKDVVNERTGETIRTYFFMQTDFILINCSKALSGEQLDAELLVKVNEYITTTYPNTL